MKLNFPKKEGSLSTYFNNNHDIVIKFMQINFDTYSRFIKLLMETKCIVDDTDFRQNNMLAIFSWDNLYN